MIYNNPFNYFFKSSSDLWKSGNDPFSPSRKNYKFSRKNLFEDSILQLFITKTNVMKQLPDDLQAFCHILSCIAVTLNVFHNFTFSPPFFFIIIRLSEVFYIYIYRQSINWGTYTLRRLSCFLGCVNGWKWASFFFFLILFLFFYK